MRENSGKSYSLIANISRKLNRIRKKFLTWRKELRINDAKDLLLMHPNAPACHIGFVVGLCDKSNFRQQFREVVGCTPLEWRKRNLKEYDCDDTKK